MNNLYQINHTIELLHDSDHFYMICFNLQGQYTYANKSYTHKFSFSGDLPGLVLHNTLHTGDMPLSREVGAKCKENPGVFFPSVIRKIDRNGCIVKTQWENVLIVEEDQPI